MNQNLYRLVFNAARGQVMAVSEISSACGKSASGETAPGTAHSQSSQALDRVNIAQTAIKTIAVSALAFGVVCAPAQIVADRNAPGNQQPQIVSTANGLPQVNIQAPSAAGVSRNVYSQFDVQRNGAILNNSATNVQTQLGGWIQGNGNLAAGSARVILNEVNSSSPSQLKGFIEVAGQRAEVIIANPAGIAVDGGGFINASGATLTTGTPIINGGNLDGYRVQGGAVIISGAGLDTSTADYTNIIARAVQVNTGIWAKDLKVTTGANEVNAANTTATAIAGTGAAPAFAIDVAALGGMYAGKITLIGTEAGVGVRNSGVIGATAGDVVLNSNGWLSNSGVFHADGNAVQINAKSIDNASGAEISGATTQLTVADTLTNRGLIDSTNASDTAQTRIDATTINNLGDGRIYGDTVSIAATTLNNDAETVNGSTTAGTIAARTRLDVGATTLNNLQGAKILSLGDTAIAGSLDANRQAAGEATNVTNSASIIEAQGALRIHSAQINNLNPILEWGADAGTTGISGTLYLTPQGTFDSNDGAVLATSGWTAMAHGGYAYQTTEYVPCSSLGEFAVCGNNPNALVPMTSYGQGAAQQNSSSGAVTFNGLVNYTQTDYKAVITKSTPGRIASGGDMSLQASQSIVNDQSEIVAGGALTVTAPLVDNRARTIQLDSVRTGTGYYWSQYDEGCGNVKGCNYNYQAYRPQGYQSNITRTQVLDTHVTQSHAANATAPRTVTSVPNSSLYRVNSSPSASYLVTTDPRFTNYKSWLSSDYMLTSLALDPSVTQKRLGDGFYEQQLIREQVAQLTGRRFLANYASDQQEYQALMTAGVTYANAYNLRPGIALSAEQVARLTSDIVWLQQENVTLADGTVTQALVPHVYLAVKTGDLAPSGALLGGNTVAVSSSGDIRNSGTILGRQLVQLDATNIQNTLGQIQGQDVVLSAGQDINNTGGTVLAHDNLIVQAGRDINVTSTTQSTSGQSGNYSYSQSGIDRVAGLYVSGGEGILLASAGRDFNLGAAQISSASSATLNADNNLNLQTIQSSQTNNFGAGSADHHLLTSQSQDVGSQINANGNVVLRAGNDLNAKAATVQAGGDLSASAGNSVNIIAGQKNSSYDFATKSTSSDLLSSTTTVQRDTATTQTAVGSSLGGVNVSVASGQDITVKGSNVLADQSLILSAGNNVSIQADQDTQTSSHFYSKSESGLLSSGGMSITLGSREQSQANKTTSTTAVASTVGSIGGDVSITAGKAYTQTGSDVVAPAGDIRIAAQTVEITSQAQNSTNRTDTEFKQSGLTLSISSPVLSAMQTVQSMGEAAGKVKDGRMKALAVASAGSSVYNAINDAQKAGSADSASAAESVGSVSISLSIGSSSSSSHSTSDATTQRGSTVSAGGDIIIKASGDAAKSDITVAGSSIQANQTVTLDAQHQLNLVSTQSTTQDTSTNESSSSSVGVGFSLGKKTGFSINASASQANGNGNGSSVTQNNTLIQGQQVALNSGGDTNIAGAVVKGDKVVGVVGDNLNIESRQDTETYKASSNNASASGSIGFGTTNSATVSVGKSNTNSDYASVSQQSGIKTGDAGFDITVGGKTSLTGGVISTTDAGVAQGNNKLSSAGGIEAKDIQNSASYKAESSQITVGTSAGSSSAGFGNESGNASSTTHAGVSGIAGNTAARSTDAETGIQKIFDKQAVADNVNAQVQITQTAGQQIPKATATYADNQTKALQVQAAAAAKEGNKAQAEALTAEADKWKEGGAYRVTLHTAFGALSGGVGGAVGAGAVAVNAQNLNDLQDQLTQTLVKAGADPAVAKAVANVTFNAGAMAAGNALGGAAGAAAALNVDANNRQLHPDERKLAAQLAAQSKGKYTATQIENAMRSSGNAVMGESVVTGMVVSGNDNAAIYDQGTQWQKGENGKLVQVLPNGGKVDAGLAAFLTASTGFSTETYSWSDAQLGKLPVISSDPNASVRWSGSPGWGTGDVQAGIPTGKPNPPDYVTIQGGAFGVNGAASVNLLNGDVFLGGSKGNMSPAPGVSAVVGTMITVVPPDRSRAEAVSDMLGGGSAQAGACFTGVCVGVNQSIGQVGTNPPLSVEVGIGTPGISVGVGASVNAGNINGSGL